MPVPTAIPQTIWERLLNEARKDPAIECCGLLGGREGAITSVYPANNDLASARAYEIAPAELFRVMREIRGAGEEFVGIYHSHPVGENQPSARDLDSAYYPDVAYVIVSPSGLAPNPVRAFSIQSGVVVELKLNVI
jgi:[CysO sulfur-carrier protein]-S-L-cysteine hydrolase